MVQASALAGISFPGAEKYQGDEGVPGRHGEAVGMLEEDDTWIDRAIRSQRPRSAPGVDGMGAPIVQLIWKWGRREIHRLMTECIRAGVHCQIWKGAKGVVIPKPGKEDYSLCKSYRVISLLSCLGKVLERVAAGLLEIQAQSTGATHGGQFGSIRRRSAIDAVATLVTFCDREWSKGRVVGALCMDVQAVFPSVNPRCMTRQLREQGIDEALVSWVRDFMSHRTVQMVIGGEEQQPIDATSGLPQGSPISPLLFALYMAGLHRFMEQHTRGVVTLSFVDDVTLLVSATSVREVSAQLERGARQAILWGKKNVVTFETGKTEAILLSRSRRHWKDKTRESILVDDCRVGYNRGATRWLGIWIDSRLSFRENTEKATARARKAETRLSSFMRRNGVPPLSARHLQEAIVGSTLMYGSEVTWRGQKFMTDSIQRAINRMTRSSLGTLGSTPVHFLQTMGGSMPAESRLQFRQSCYAGRLASSEASEIRDITTGDGELARRLRSTLCDGEGVCPTRVDNMVERVRGPRGLRFPGLVDIPQAASDKEEGERQRERARVFASGFTETEHTFWTDGSAYPGGVAAGAVVTYLVDQDMSDDDPLAAPRVSLRKRGIIESRPQGWYKREGKRRGRTYKEDRRSFVKHRCEGGLVAEAWTLRGRASAFDAELSALARAVELSAHGAVPGSSVRIFTDSQAAMRRVLDDRPGPGQWEAVRCIIGARRLQQRGAAISIHWVPGHAGITGNEIADQWAGDAAARELRRGGKTPSEARVSPVAPMVSGAFMKAMFRRRAIDSWRESIVRGGSRRRPYVVPRDGTIPKIPTALGRARRELAVRFFQLASGHAMTAPFLKEKFGWVSSDQCWWCGSGRQSREHLFKECLTWKKEIKKLWKEVGEISLADREVMVGRSGGKRYGRRRKKGFGFVAHDQRVSPGNCTVGRLMSDQRFTEAILSFLEGTQIGLIKKGVIVRGEEAT